MDIKSILKNGYKRYAIDALGAMALGLFSSLIIGLILNQLAQISFLSFLKEFTEIISAKSPVVGCAIGVAVAWGLKSKPLVLFTSAVTGAFGYSLGGPVGSFFAAVFGAELGNLVSGKTKVDIIIVPTVTIVVGCLVGKFIGPHISNFMTSLGNAINEATKLRPIPMGIIIGISMGMLLTSPISSAAIAISLGMSGLAAGAATVGCSAQMIGFAVASYKENKLGGFIAQGLGTSMLQVPNIMKRPQIWIPPTIAGAILGPLSTKVFKMVNSPYGAGMGTSGLVGQIGTWAEMYTTQPAALLIAKILLLHFILPSVITLIVLYFLKKKNWIKDGDMKLEL